VFPNPPPGEAPNGLQHAQIIICCPLFLTCHTIRGTALDQEAEKIFLLFSWNTAKETKQFPVTFGCILH
jgi:hypothetical protein